MKGESNKMKGKNQLKDFFICKRTINRLICIDKKSNDLSLLFLYLLSGKGYYEIDQTCFIRHVP